MLNLLLAQSSDSVGPESSPVQGPGIVYTRLHYIFVINKNIGLTVVCTCMWLCNLRMHKYDWILENPS